MPVAFPSFLYAALGDSTGVGVGASDGRGYAVRLFERLRVQRADVRLLNLSVSGATSRGVIEMQLPRALTASPRLATVFMGINDLVQGIAQASFARNVERAAEQLSESGVRTLFCTLPDLAEAPAARFFMSHLGVQRASFEARTRAFNALIVEAAQRHGHLVHDLFSVPLDDRAHFFSADGFHPSSHGYEELADRLWPDFQTLAEQS